MYQNKKIVAIITARAGSKEIKDKNLYPICGKPLIEYTFEQAKKSVYLDDIYCTTDGQNIADFCSLHDIKVINRPSELAQDTSKTIDCIIHAKEYLKQINQHFDYLLILQPTSPLRTPQEIDGIIKECIDNDFIGMTSVHQVKNNPILLRYFNQKTLSNLIDQNSSVRRQDMPQNYYVNGSLYLYKINELSLKTGLNDIPYGYNTQQMTSLDINDMSDITYCEYLLKTL